MKKLFFVLTEQDSMFRILAGENRKWKGGGGGIGLSKEGIST